MAEVLKQETIVLEQFRPDSFEVFYKIDGMDFFRILQIARSKYT